jgi:conjugative relaxase-like TrwC/TraI family protein
MLSLAPVSAHQGQTYYAQENYYTQNRTVENSEWQGIGAQHLGLRGNIAAREFQTLLEGVSPRSKQKLNGDGDTNAAEHRAGIDLTFSAPKSVSLAAFVGHDDRLEEAHRESVRIALKVAEERYSQTRTGNKKFRDIEVTGNLVIAKFHHDTSRAKDPQMHTHCVVINAVQRADGNWRSLHNEALYQNSKFLGLVYQNELASRVQRLGYSVEVKNNGTFEIAGYTEGQLEKFSKRREQLEELGVENQKQARSAVTKNRPKKGPEIPREELNKVWQKEAHDVGIIHPHPHQSLSIQEEKLIVPDREVLRQATAHASERDVSFRREQVESFALESKLGRLNWEEFQGAIRAAQSRGEIIRNAEKLWTTEICLLREIKILDALCKGKEAFAPVVTSSHEKVQKIHPELSQGQADAVLLTLQSRDQFIAWQGVAGAGKTYAMNVVRELTQEAKISIRGFAPSAEAAKVLQQESGIPAQTVAACLVESQARQGTREGELWIVDEAGLLSARDCQALMLKAQEQKARVVFVGDTRQLSSVGAGNPFQLLQKSEIATAYLSEGRRQKSEDLKIAVQALSEGNVELGFERLEKRITELRREETRVRHVSSNYVNLSAEERSQTLVLAGTNRERNLLTDEIRERLKEQGVLGNSMQIVSLRQRDLTAEQALNPIHLREGDILVFHRSFRAKGIERNVAYEVVRKQESSVRVRGPTGKEMTVCPQREKAFVVYEKRETEFAVGDRVRWTRNDKERGVRNGQDAVIVDAKEGVISVQNKDGQRANVPQNSLQHLDHNYVNTVFSSQGKTCHKVIISADNTFGKEALYVAVSRAKFDAQIFTEDRDTLLRNASVSHAKKSVFDLLSEQKLRTEKNSMSLESEKELSRSRKRS